MIKNYVYTGVKYTPENALREIQFQCEMTFKINGPRIDDLFGRVETLTAEETRDLAIMVRENHFAHKIISIIERIVEKDDDLDEELDDLYGEAGP